MAHMAVETLLAEPVLGVTDSKNHKETEHALREFWKSTAALRNVLGQDRSLNELDLLLLENHFHALKMAYLWWKRKQQHIPQGVSCT